MKKKLIDFPIIVELVSTGKMNSQNGETSIDGSKSTDHMNLISSLIEQNELLTHELVKCNYEESEKRAKIEVLKIEMERLQSSLDDLDRKAEEVQQSLAASKGGRTSEEIEELLATYDRLKFDEKQFKEMCNQDLERFRILVFPGGDTEVPSSNSEVTAQLQRAETRLEAGRTELGNVNRRLALLKRQIDQVPNRIELREYRLRFSELYNQVSATHRQTKQFFSLYNSLEDTKRYLEKELSLLNSIIDSYHQVSQSGSGRVDFLSQLSSLHEGLNDACNKVDKRHQNERLSVDKLQHELQRLLGQRVSYEKCLKELEMECKTNDKLLASLKTKEPVGVDPEYHTGQQKATVSF